LSAPLVLLVGLPGAGKSTVARAVANKLSCDLVEMDEVIEQIAAVPVGRIFSSIGEAGFRRFEVEATRLLRERATPAIVAAGGGWIANGRARALVLPTWRTIYLRVSSLTAGRRLAGGTAARPLLAGAKSEEDLVARLEQLARERVPLYERADTTIDTEAGTLAEVIDRVAEVAFGFLYSGSPLPISRANGNKEA
jgi:shikimate kinase